MAEPIFKACTRTAMVFSVPTKPLIISNGLIIFVVMWANFFFSSGLLPILLVIPNYIILRLVSKIDDAIFSLLWLKIKCRRSSNRNQAFYGATVYSPLEFKKRGK